MPQPAKAKLGWESDSHKILVLIALHQLGTDAYHRYTKTGDVSHLGQVIIIKQRTLELYAADHPHRGGALNNLAASLLEQFERTGHHDDLVEATRTYHKAFRLLPVTDPDRTYTLSDLADRLSSARQFENAIVLYRQVLEWRPFGHKDRILTVSALANCLSRHFKQAGDLTELTEAVSLEREALSLCPVELPSRSILLNNLAMSLAERYPLTLDESDLEEAICLGREALQLMPTSHPDRFQLTHNLATYLSKRCEGKGDATQLSELVYLYQEAVRAQPAHHPSRDLFLHNLACSHVSLYQSAKNSKHLEEAIHHFEEVSKLRPKGHPARPMVLSNLAMSLAARSKQSLNNGDRLQAIRLYEEALSLQPTSDPERPQTVNNLASCLLDHFKQTADKDNLGDAIHFLRESVSLHPEGHHYGDTLNNLASCHLALFKQTGSDNDLTAAIDFYRAALPHTANRQSRDHIINNLAASLAERSRLQRDIGDLTEAINLNEELLLLRPKDHPERGGTLDNLALCLSDLFKLLGSTDDLVKAICLHREALDLRPIGHPERGESLNNFAMTFGLQQAVLSNTRQNSESSVEATARESNLDSDLQIQNELMGMLREATLPSPSSISARLAAAENWRAWSQYYVHESQLDAMVESLNLIDESVRQSRTLEKLYNHLSQNRLVRDAQTISSDAAALAIQAGDVRLAVVLLERGRAMIFTQLNRYRQALDAVQEAAPALAQRFMELSASMNNLVIHDETAAATRDAKEGAFKDLGVRYYEEYADWAKTVDEIRQVRGLEDFLRPPSFEYLRRAATGGPVVLININEARSDAIIVTSPNNPFVVPLPEATQKATRHLASRFGERPAECHDHDAIYVLREIWRTIMSAIVDQLLKAPIKLRKGSRIWLCPIGPASRLPLHAAGPYVQGERNLANYFVPSYTPTLSGLIRARQSGTATSLGPRNPAIDVLVVGQPDTPGERPLPKVIEEVKAIRQRAPRASVLQSAEGTREAVLDGLTKHTWLHLACHGHYHPTHPLQSHFSLYNGPITLLDLIEKDLPQAELAVLSACHSARVSETLPDEGLHPAAGMMVAGCKSVVGTMWALDDGIGSVLADRFYELMLGGEDGPKHYSDAAVVLAKAFDALGREGYKIPFMQRINVVHYGV